MKQGYTLKSQKYKHGTHSLKCKCDICFERLIKAKQAANHGGGYLRKAMQKELKNKDNKVS